jgi:hypothetical protein
MTGLLIRLALIICWLGLTGAHVAQTWLPQLGLAPSQDAGAILKTRLDRGLSYDLLWTPAPGREAELVGTCRIETTTDDVGFRIASDIQLTNLHFVPGLDAVRRFLPGAKRSGGVRLRVTELLDANQRLRAIEADGNLLGIAFSATGPVDHRGYDVAWKAGGAEGRHLLAQIRPEQVAGGELSVGLPAGLKPGMSFTSRMLAPDPVRMTATMKTAAFTVAEPERVRTRAGQMQLMPVTMQIDGRRTATLWADAQGVVYRQLSHDQGLELVLTRIDADVAAGGRQVWPAP